MSNTEHDEPDYELEYAEKWLFVRLHGWGGALFRDERIAAACREATALDEHGRLQPLVPNEITGGTADPAWTLVRRCAPFLAEASVESAVADTEEMVKVLNWLNSQRPRPEWREGHAAWLIEEAVYEHGAARMHARMDAASRVGEEDRRIALGDADRIRDAGRLYR